MVAKSITTQDVTLSPTRVAEELVAYLATSGRVFSVRDGPWILVNPSSGAITNLGEGVTFLRNLILGGLVEVYEENDRRLGPGRKLNDIGGFFATLREHFPTAMPQAKSIVKLPAFRFSADGRRLVRAQPGFCVDDLVLYTPNGAVALPEPDPSYPHLKEWFSGILFADPVYHGNLMGTIAAMFSRTAGIEFPLILLDANEKSVGKSKVATAIGLLLTGSLVDPCVFTGNEEEMERRIAKNAKKPGPTYLFVDNVRPKKGQAPQIRSQVLCTLATQKSVLVRALYEGLVPVFDPIAVITMNGARVEPDLADRIVRVSLMRPPGPANHREIDPHPVKYAEEHRGALLAEVFHLLENLELTPVQGGRWFTRFYDFERVAVAAAAALGLEASFDPSRIQNADAIVHELYYLLVDKFEGRASFPQLVEAITVSTRLTELREFLLQQGRVDRGLALFLQEYVQGNFVGKPFRLDKKQISFIIVADTHLNQSVLEVR